MYLWHLAYNPVNTQLPLLLLPNLFRILILPSDLKEAELEKLLGRWLTNPYLVLNNQFSIDKELDKKRNSGFTDSGVCRSKPFNK